MAATRGTRCPWAGSDPLYVEYHDREWGVPSRDDRALFEKLVLEGAQAGLSWITVLRKRPRYRERFAGFDPEKVARFDRRKIDSLMKDEGLIRNRAKLESAVANARAFLDIQRAFDGFHRYLWSFAPRARRAAPKTLADLPAKTDDSTALSKDLKRRGMNFVGPTIAYAYMQAMGLVNDHLATCPRRRPCEVLRRAALDEAEGAPS